jgi:hypothetical protein
MAASSAVLKDVLKVDRRAALRALQVVEQTVCQMAGLRAVQLAAWKVFLKAVLKEPNWAGSKAAHKAVLWVVLMVAHWAASRVLLQAERKDVRSVEKWVVSTAVMKEWNWVAWKVSLLAV